MRFTLSMICVLAALASTADGRPAGRELSERQLLGLDLGLGGSREAQSQTSASSSKTTSTDRKQTSVVKAAASSAFSAARGGSPNVVSAVSATTSSTPRAFSASASATSRRASSSSARPSSSRATPASSHSASPIAVSSPNLSSLSSAAHSEISSAASSNSAARASASVASSSSVSTSNSTRGGGSAVSRIASNACRPAAGDAQYTLSCGDLESAITFPNGFRNRPGGIVFLVHGTGSTGEETWGPGPYNSILPNKGPGYDIAWFTSPTRSLGDAQVTAEYIAHNIKILAQRSATGKVFLIGHSQGNINIQWALKYWPSARSFVSGWSSLAGDFHGTAEGPLLCTAQALAQGGCEPSVLQQSVGSNYLGAQNNGAGGAALVPTTSIYTIFDDIIQPEIINPTSELPGAVNLRMQDLDLCGPAYVIDHFLMTVAAGPFYLTLNALENNGVADRSAFDLSMCTYLTDDSVIPNPLETIAGTIRQAALDAIAVVAYEDKIFEEPRLMPYVCQKGDSTYC